MREILNTSKSLPVFKSRELQYIYKFNANLEEEEISLFEGLWSIPNGVSLNTYIVMGEEKTALVDLVCHWDGTKIYIENEFKKSSVDVSNIDYIILNHMEPDHTGWLPDIMRKNPKIKIVTTKKAIDLVKAFYHIDSDETFIPVKTGDTLDLGGGVSFYFIEIPNVHWPETMVSFEVKSGTLFSCDAFGSYGRIENKVFDDECSKEDKLFFRKETLRYYANIVASFSDFVIRAITKVSGELEKLVSEGKTKGLKAIAPAHGLIWRENPAEIIELYQKLASYSKGPGEKKITVVWGSMYSNTEEVKKKVVEGIQSTGIEVEEFKVPDLEHEFSFSMASAFESQGLVIASPTYEYGLFPPIQNFLYLLKRKHILNKDLLLLGSFGWSGGSQRELLELITDKKGNLTYNIFDKFEWKGKAREEELKAAFERGKKFAETVMKNGI